MRKGIARLDAQASRSQARPVSARRGRTRASARTTVVGVILSVVAAGLVMAVDPGILGYRTRALIDRLEHRDVGSFVFLTRAPTGEPVGWDHCRAIRYQVDPTGAPEGWRTLLSSAVADVTAASGFRFDYVGTTRDRDFDGRAAPALGQPRPVLVAWATPQEVPALAGPVAGQGGARAEWTDGRLVYRSGSAVLDGPAFAAMTTSGHAPAARLIVEHELGHVLGLGHVHDRGELMNPEYVGQSGFGPGDRAGFARLLALPCP